MQLKTKLLVSFCSVAALCVVLGLFGLSKIHEIDDADTLLYESVTTPLEDLARAAIAFQHLRVSTLSLAAAKTREESDKHLEAIKHDQATIKENLDSFEKRMTTEEERKAYATLLEARRAYLVLLSKMMDYFQSGQISEMQQLQIGEARQTASKYGEIINNLIDLKISKGKHISDNNTSIAHGSALRMSILMVMTVLAALGLGLFITRNVTGQLGEDPGYLYEVSSEIASGNLGVRFREQKGQGGVYGVMRQMVSAMKGKISEADQKSAEAAEEARRAKLATDEAREAKAKAESAKAEGMLHAAEQLEGVVEIVSSASGQLSMQIDHSSKGAQDQAQ
jgi:methyl-accepting chemotaxis protein